MVRRPDNIRQSTVPIDLGTETTSGLVLYKLIRRLRAARSRDVAIDTINLWDFDLPYFPLGEEPDLSTLSEALRQLLEDVKALRLCRSHCVLELLTHCALDLHRLDRVANPPDSAFTEFLETNKTIQSMGYHHVFASSGQLPVSISV